MSLIDDKYSEFQVLIKQYVHLEILLAVLERDKRHLGALKMERVLLSLFDTIIDRVVNDLAKVKKAIRKLNGEILTITQGKESRCVKVKYNGYVFDIKYLNEWIRVECEEMLRRYLSLK